MLCTDYLLQLCAAFSPLSSQRRNWAKKNELLEQLCVSESSLEDCSSVYAVALKELQCFILHVLASLLAWRTISNKSISRKHWLIYKTGCGISGCRRLHTQFDSSEAALVLNLQTFHLILCLEVSNCKCQGTVHHEYIENSTPTITVEVISELLYVSEKKAFGWHFRKRLSLDNVMAIREIMALKNTSTFILDSGELSASVCLIAGVLPHVWCKSPAIQS